MISSVSFRGYEVNSPTKDLYGTPQRFQRTSPYVEDAPETKKSGKGKKIAIGAAAVAAVAALLAVLASKGKLDPKVLGEDAGKLAKGWEVAKKGLKATGDFVAKYATKAVDGVKNLFTKKGTTTTEAVGEIAEEAAEAIA